MQRKHQQKARTALLQKPYHLLTWQEKLTLEDIGRKHAAKLQQQKLEGPKCAAKQAKPPTPYNTTEVSAGSAPRAGAAATRRGSRLFSSPRTRTQRTTHARTHARTQNIIDFHHQQDDEEEDDGSESDYEGVGEYLERLVREEAEMVAAGSMQSDAALLQRAMGSSDAAGASAAAAAAAASAAGGGGGGGGGGGDAGGGPRVGSSASSALGGGGGGGASSASHEHGSAAGSSTEGRQGGQHGSGSGGGSGGGHGGKRQRGGSLDFGDAATMDEAGALLRSKEELFALLKRCRETAKRHLERALAAEAEVAALRSSSSSSSSSAVDRGGAGEKRE